MPRKALQTCAKPGCPELVVSGYCDKHKTKSSQYHQEWQCLYDTQRWQRIRAIQLSVQPWCEECLRANTYTLATDVDHVEPHRGDKRKFFSGPFQSLCKRCHSEKTATEVNGRGDQKSTG